MSYCKYIFVLLLCAILFPGFAQSGLGTDPCNGGKAKRFGNVETHQLPTLNVSTEPGPGTGDVLITAPLVPEDESPESESDPEEFPYFGLEYSQGIYRVEHNSTGSAVIRSEAPQDPNEIVGLEGYDAPGSEDTLRWVSPTQRLAYTIYFENDPALATAAASKVTITMPLHEKLDYATFGVGSFGFGSFVFPVDGSPSTYQTRIDLRDTLGIDLDVVAGLDIVRHEAFWIFQSIDPATGLPPTDINLGFLPVNDSLHSGEGFVTCTVKPLADECATGDTVAATASIVFDVNEAIETNTWVNTIDAVAPTSTLTMTPNNAGDMLTATFDGEDDEGGCGVKQFKLYYSVNDNAYQLYNTYPAGNSAEIPLEMGMEYEFFVLAEDNVGNCEPMKNQPEFNIGTSNFTLTVEVLPQDAGTADGGGSYPLGDTARLVATPAEGYHFVNWMNGGVPVSTDNPYKVEMTQNQTYTAFFELNQYTLLTEAAAGSTITVTDLSGNEIPSGSNILHFDKLLVTIDTADCYIMENVKLNGVDYVPGETLTVTGDVILTTTTTEPLIAYVEVLDTVCQGYAYEGHGFTLSETETVVPGLIERTLTVPSVRTGCDSVVKTLHLTVNPSAASDDHLDICTYELPYTYGDTLFEVGTESSVFNFHLSTVDGCDSIVTLFLTVDPCLPEDPDAVVVVIAGHHETVGYDGTEHSVSGYDVRYILIDGVATTLYTEDDFSLVTGATATANRTDVGQTVMGLTAESFVNNNTDFATVEFRVTDGYMTITPATLAITANSATKVYDGTPLTDDGFVVTSTLGSGDAVTATVNGYQTCKGESANVIDPATVQVMHDNGDNTYTDVTANYSPVTLTDGILKVTPIIADLVCPETVTFTLPRGVQEITLTESDLNGPATLDPAPAHTHVGSNLSSLNPMGAGMHTVVWALYDDCDSVLTTCEQIVNVWYAECEGVTSFHGHFYDAVRIGTQCWFTENLQWATGKHKAFGDDDANVEKFGYLYSWYTAMGVPENDNSAVPATQTGYDGEPYVQGICPDGWAVANEADFALLFATAGSTDLLKDPSTLYWLSGHEGAVPSTGFSARANGHFNSETWRYEDQMTGSYFWMPESATTEGLHNSMVIQYYCSDGLFQYHPKTDLQGVRCIRKVSP